MLFELQALSNAHTSTPPPSTEQ